MATPVIPAPDMPTTTVVPTITVPATVVPPTLDPDGAYKLHPKVALRPEPFGALAYHYGNRKLVFLKSPRMVALVRDLGSFATLGAALTAAGLTERSRPKYLAALESLALSDMLIPVP
jgi:putative mycofactocin binding protein MftB